MLDDPAVKGTIPAAMRCNELRAEFGDVSAVAGVSLHVAPGEVVALLGRSGCGKSTLLHLIAGLVRPSSGEVWLDGRCVAGGDRHLAPHQRSIGMVFQNGALWPHLCVLDTVAYPLRRAGRSPRAAESTAMRLLVQLGIAPLARRRPAELSGGEQQRVGLARALAREARLYLLDEPTAHLDTGLRQDFQELIADNQRRTGAAVLLATHDPAEGLALAHRVALMKAGQLIQVGPPDEVYGEPACLDAARLTGPCSVLHARVSSADAATLTAELSDGTTVIVPGTKARTGPCSLLVRPDWVHDRGELAGMVTATQFRGPHSDYRIDSAAGSLLMSLPGAPRYRSGDRLRWGLSRVWGLSGETGPATSQPSAVIAAG